MDTCHLRKVNWLAFLTWPSCSSTKPQVKKKKKNVVDVLSLWIWVGKWLFHSKTASCMYRFPCYKIKQVIYDSPYFQCKKVKWKKVWDSGVDLYGFLSYNKRKKSSMVLRFGYVKGRDIIWNYKNCDVECYNLYTSFLCLMLKVFTSAKSESYEYDVMQVMLSWGHSYCTCNV